MNKHYQNYDKFELLLYSNTHLPNVDKEIVIKFLTQNLNEWIENKIFTKVFESISIIYGQEVWLNILKSNK